MSPIVLILCLPPTLVLEAGLGEQGLLSEAQFSLFTPLPPPLTTQTAWFLALLGITVGGWYIRAEAKLSILSEVEPKTAVTIPDTRLYRYLRWPSIWLLPNSSWVQLVFWPRWEQGTICSAWVSYGWALTISLSIPLESRGLPVLWAPGKGRGDAYHVDEVIEAQRG